MNSLQKYRNETAISLVKQNNAFVLKKLLQCYSKSHLDEVDADGNTALLLAAYSGSPKCVCALLSAGANYQQINVFGQNALTLATHSGSIECVRMLLAKWTYLEYNQSAIMPPLCVAAFRGHLELVKMFSKMYPAPEHIKTIHGVNPLMLAMTGGHMAVELYLSDFYPRLWKEKTPYGQTATELIKTLPNPSVLLARNAQDPSV